MPLLYPLFFGVSVRGFHTSRLDAGFRLSKLCGMDIRTFRKSRGLTLEALGRALGVTKGYLCQIEKGSACSQAVALKLEDFSSGALDAALLSPAVAAARKPAVAA